VGGMLQSSIFNPWSWIRDARMNSAFARDIFNCYSHFNATRQPATIPAYIFKLHWQRRH